MLTYASYLAKVLTKVLRGDTVQLGDGYFVEMALHDIPNVLDTMVFKNLQLPDLLPIFLHLISQIGELFSFHDMVSRIQVDS